MTLTPIEFDTELNEDSDKELVKKIRASMNKYGLKFKGPTGEDNKRVIKKAAKLAGLSNKDADHAFSVWDMHESINEGAWGHGPLDNDSASDQKWEVARNALKGIDKQLADQSEPDGMYHAIGLWLDLEDRLETQYTYFTDDIKAKYHALAKEACEWLLENPDKLADHYREPKKIEKILKNMLNWIEEKEAT